MAKPVLYIKSATARQMRKWRKDGDPVAMCAHFGCGRHLTLFEQLCGDKCVGHSGRGQIKIVDEPGLIKLKNKLQ